MTLPIKYYAWLSSIEDDVRVRDLTEDEIAGLVAATRPAPDMAAVVEAKPQDHWTAKGAIASARALIEAGNKLCLMAETSGGTAGRDDGLVDAINHWAAERDKHKQVLRIIELEGHEPEIGAGYESLSAALQSLRCQQGEYICKCGLRVEPHRCRDTKGDF